MVFELNNYNSLSLFEKADILRKKTIFLVNLLETELIYSLYFYHNYYIEVMIHNKTNDLLDIRAFKDTKQLDKYIDNIDLIVGENYGQ